MGRAAGRSFIPMVRRLALYDAAVTVLAPVAAIWLTGSDRDAVQFHSAFYGLIATPVMLGVLFACGTGRALMSYTSAREVISVVCACIAAVGVTVAACGMSKAIGRLPPAVVVIHAGVATTLLVLGRLFATARRRFRESARATGRNPETIVLLGANTLACSYIRFAAGSTRGPLRVAAIVDGDRRLQGRSLMGCPVLGGINAFERIVRELRMHGVRVDRVVSALPDGTEVPRDVAAFCQTHAIEVSLLPRDVRATRSTRPSGAHGGPAVSSTTMREGFFRASKRAFDVAGAILLALVLLPVMAVVICALLLESGVPVFFWQRRVGRHGRAFVIYKLRTLRNLYDARGERRTDAQRRCSVGSLVRRLRFDESLQLWNIVRGDMSFVGPRPLLMEDQPDNSRLRLDVRPGITGWAQIHGGQFLNRESKGTLDDWYVRNARWTLDLRILGKTFGVLVSGDSRAAAGGSMRVAAKGRAHRAQDAMRKT